MEMSYLEATAWRRSAVGTYETAIDPTWLQGRGAYGGLLGAGILRSLTHALESPRRAPRSLTVHFAAPALPGPLKLTIVREREGASVAHFSARVLQNGAVVCIATATFASPRATQVTYDDVTVPEVSPADAISALPFGPPLPTFCQHFELRPAIGHYPYTSAAEAVCGGYVRIPGAGLLDAPLAVALLDAWPPAVTTRLAKPAPAATVDFTVHFFHELPVPDAKPDEPHLVVVRSRIAGHGYGEELCELFSPRTRTGPGQLLAQARQLVALV